MFCLYYWIIFIIVNGHDCKDSLVLFVWYLNLYALRVYESCHARLWNRNLLLTNLKISNWYFAYNQFVFSSSLAGSTLEYISISFYSRSLTCYSFVPLLHWWHNCIDNITVGNYGISVIVVMIVAVVFPLHGICQRPVLNSKSVLNPMWIIEEKTVKTNVIFACTLFIR